MSRQRQGKSRNWARRQLSDPYTKSAREQGYASRAAFKLVQIDQRDRILRPGMSVVDLGAAPGSWSQYVIEKIGPTGTLVAVDRAEIGLNGLTAIQGDICEETTLNAIGTAIGDKSLDLVLSDMAPDITGIRDTDEAHFADILGAVDVVLTRHLRQGGKALIKLFQGESADEFRDQISRRFDRLAVRKPQSSRSESREYFVYATGYQRSKITNSEDTTDQTM